MALTFRFNNPVKAWHDYFGLLARPRPTRSSASATGRTVDTTDIDAVKEEFQIGRKKEFWD